MAEIVDTNQNSGSQHELERKIAILEEENFILKSNNEALISDKERYRLIAEFVLDWDFWISPDGKLEWISPSCSDLTGYTSEEFLRDPNLLYNIIYPDDEAKFRDYFREVQSFLQIGKTLEFRILTRTKQLRWCEINCKSIFDRLGGYLGQRASVRDITRLVNALGQIRTMSDRNVWQEKAKMQYRDELAGKDREMVSSLLVIAQKNELVHYLRRNLNAIRGSVAPQLQPKMNEMILRIDEQIRRHSFRWDDFKIHFEKVYPGFFVRLLQRFPGLTQKDLKMCAYIRMGLSTKDIASLINITPESAEISRIRLRRKMQLDRAVNLVQYLSVI